MKKKLLSVLLATSLVLSGLGAMTLNAFADEAAEEEAAEEEDEEDEEYDEINVSWLTTIPLDPSVTDPIVEALNEITEEEIGVHVNIVFYDPGAYSTQIPMEIQANAKLDLLMYTPIPGSGYLSFKNQGQLLDISEYLDEYGQGVKEALGDLLDGTTDPDGSIYGVASNRVLGSTLNIIMRTDVLEELGLLEKAQNMTTWTEYEEILKEVVDKTDYAGVGNCDVNGSTIAVSPYFTGDDAFANGTGFDSLGDTTSLIASDKEGHVISYYGSDDYRAEVERAQKFYDEGLIYKDASVSQEYNVNLIKAGTVFSTISSAELGGEELSEAICGFDLTYVPVAASVCGSDTTHKFGFAVPVCATDPEAAVKFLNLLFTNSDTQNMLAWGLEGRDWVEKDGEAVYPEGVTSDTVQFHMGDYLNGNQFITLPWEGSGADFRAVQQEFQDQLVFSPYMGFNADTSEVTNEITSCFGIIEQYRKQLSSGSSGDWEATLDEMNGKLEAAGIDKVVECYQTQLDAWLAEQQ